MAAFERLLCPFVGCYKALSMKVDTPRERRDLRILMNQHRWSAHRGARSLLDNDRQEKWHYDHKPGE